ncbi:hypothetical protein D3869_21995 (plasmid) [Azospirillum brasilense]|uniref:Uncharacterized protein n=1 Tax=Azospirillum brasilense TaxID=192 RepID=A0A4D8R3U7_AZOBR|nr:hypothetical protein [Azospirillum brasilense]QCO18015.1 hypothetical protein D3869_21995 [Azospirillum brasilense]
MKPIAAVVARIAQFFVAALLLMLVLMLAACGEGGSSHGGDYVVGYGASGPVYTLGLGLPAYRLEPRTYWNYPDYRGNGPTIELAGRPNN